MKPLASKTVPPRIAERGSAIPVLVLIVLGFHILNSSQGSSPSTTLPCRKPIYVQAEGEVGYPGVYAFCKEPQAADVLSQAVARSRQCETDDLLETATLSSGTRLILTRQGQVCKVSRSEMCAHQKISLGIPISVNRENQEGLTAIPGIGARLAEAIVQERELRGGFKTMDEVLGVRGIGKALLKKIRPHLTL